MKCMYSARERRKELIQTGLLIVITLCVLALVGRKIWEVWG